MEFRMVFKSFMSFALLSFLFLANGCLGYPDGPPESVCDSMKPSHGVDPQATNTTPYAIDLDSDYYKTGRPVRVTVSNKHDNTSLIKGLLVEATQVGKSFGAIGSFQKLPDGTKFLKCHSNEKGAVSHKQVLDTRSITFEWLPPDDISELGNVSFYVTVVKTKEVYWVKILSARTLMRDASCPSGKPTCDGADSTSGFKFMLLFVALAFGWFI